MNDNVHNVLANVCNTLRDCALKSRRRTHIPRFDGKLERWQKLINDNNDADIWRAISWKGEYEYERGNEQSDAPSNEEFQ